MSIEKINADLLDKLRSGDIWDLERDQVLAWLTPIDSLGWQRDLTSMRLRSLIAEVADRRGWWYDVEPAALRNLEPIAGAFYAVAERLSSTDARLPWFRQAGWLLLHDARRIHRSSTGHSAARKRAAKDALEFAIRLQTQLALILPSSGNHELLYRVAFSIARHRQVLEEYADTEKDLITALIHCCQHRQDLLEAGRLHGDEEYCQRLQLKDSFVLFNTVVVLANIGRVAVEQGHLTRAQPILLAAKTMLLDSDDYVMRGFVDFQLGCIYRQIGSGYVADHSQLSLDTAIPGPEEFFNSAIDLFNLADHAQLRARTTLELAQYYYNRAARFDNDDHLKAKELLERENPFDLPKGAFERWEAHRQLLLARIEYVKPQHNHSLAISHAKRALELSIDVARKDLETVARLVLAELNIEAKEYEDALKQCYEVETINPVDNSDQAWLYLVFAKAFLKRGNRGGADSYFQRWKAIEVKVENIHIKKKGTDIERELKTQTGFYISASENEDLNYDRRVEELKLFLMQQVQTSNSLEEQARKLGVKKNTLANWRVEMMKSKKLDAIPRKKKSIRSASSLSAPAGGR